MNPWVLLGGGLAMLSLLAGSFHVGRVYERAGALEAKVEIIERVVERDKVIIKEVPKIVTKVVTREVEVVKEVDRVVEKIPHMLVADCVLPDNYGMLLVSAANGIDPAAGGADAYAGEYGCREVLAATLKDLSAGWRNTARLGGLQAAARLVIEQQPPTTEGASP